MPVVRYTKLDSVATERIKHATHAEYALNAGGARLRRDWFMETDVRKQNSFGGSDFHECLRVGACRGSCFTSL